jgi:GntR family transcriptional regulator, rspAB operon transcriptional repressor
MVDHLQLPVIEPVGRPSVADQVFDELRRQILTLEVAPGTKLSEVDVATQMGVSRQPVRDAFYRLSKLGFLLIRPQRATTVTLISESAVMQARFVRTALEIETMRSAVDRLGATDFAALDALIEAQRVAMEAGDKPLFHALDDQFHMEICDRAGVGFVWDLVADRKAHTDRVRMLSLAFASRLAWEDHLAIMAALKARDAEAASNAVRTHLSRIRDQIAVIRAANHTWFEGDA